MVSGGQAGVSRQRLGGVFCQGRFAIGQDAGGGMMGHSGDGAEQIDLVLEQGVGGTQVFDGLLDFGQLPFQRAFEGGGGSPYGDRQAGDEALGMLTVGPLADGGPNGVSLADQGIELLQSRRFRLPGWRFLALGEGENHQSIDLVGLGSAQLGFGEGGDLDGIDDADLGVGELEQGSRQTLAVDTGSFHAKMQDVLGVLLPGPSAEFLYALGGMIETAGFLSGHCSPEFILADIDSDWQSSLAHDNLPG